MTPAEQMPSLQQDGLDVCTKKKNLLERLYFIAINGERGGRRRPPPPKKKQNKKKQDIGVPNGTLSLHYPLWVALTWAHLSYKTQ